MLAELFEMLSGKGPAALTGQDMTGGWARKIRVWVNSAGTIDPVTGHAVCLQIHGLAEDIGIVSSIVFPGVLHDFLIVRRLGDDVDKGAYAFLVLGPFRIGKGSAIILKAE